MSEANHRIVGAGRWGGPAFVLAIGVVTATAAASHITRFDEPIGGVIFSVITTMLGLSLVAGGYWLHARSDFDGEQRLRVALWTILGTLLLTFVLILMISYQHAEGARVEDPVFFVGGTVTLGAAGGFLIGTYDAGRVHAQEVITEKEKIELFNQVLRHNILNATNVLQGRAQLLQQHVESEGQHHLDSVLEQSAAISELTQKIRTLVEETQRTDAYDKPIDVADVLEERVEKRRAAHENVTIPFENDSAESTVMADGMLPEVFDNLLDNAIEYNDSDDLEVRVSIETTENSVVTRIEDDGPGVPDRVRKPLAEGSSTDLRETGIGLRLYLVSRFVDRYAGEISVEDREPHGTVVDVELPRANA